MSNTIKDSYFQHIPLDGTGNFRDLGGRKNKYGQTLRRQKLYRSGELSRLTTQDWMTLSSLNVKKIYDFRRQDELKRHPTSAPPAIDIIHLPVGDGSHRDLFAEIFSQTDISNAHVEQLMERINREFISLYPDVFSCFLKKLLDTSQEEACVFHCSAGKDRTGFAAAITLLLLDFDEDEVFEDYLLTGSYFSPKLELKRILKLFPEGSFDGFDHNEKSIEQLKAQLLI